MLLSLKIINYMNILLFLDILVWSSWNIVYNFSAISFLISITFSLIFLGFIGALINKNNLFKLLLCLELLFLGVNLFIIILGLLLLDIKCFIIALILFASTAAESVIILSLLIAIFNLNRTINLNTLSNFK